MVLVEDTSMKWSIYYRAPGGRAGMFDVDAKTYGQAQKQARKDLADSNITPTTFVVSPKPAPKREEEGTTEPKK